MNTMRSPTSRAKPISWVTTIIVMPTRGELAHHVEHLADQLGVEGRGRLVEQHHLGIHRQRAGDRHALLLAAGQLVGELGHVGQQADLAELDARRARARRAWRVLRPAQGDGDVVEGAEVREQVELLEHHADGAAQLDRPAAPRLLAGQPGAVLGAVDLHRARRRRLEEVDRAQERRLARPGRAEHDDVLAGRHQQVDPLQHFVRPEALVDRAQPDRRFGDHACTMSPMRASERQRASGRSGLRGRGTQ